MTGSSAERARTGSGEWVRKGCVDHCPDQHVHVASLPPTQRWGASGISAGIVLHGILPYMQTDRGFREAYAQVLTDVTGWGQGFGAVLPAVRRLARLGWVLPDFVMTRMLGAYGDTYATA
jgi:hypothetical protein